MSVMSLEATDYSGVERLNSSCKIWFEENQLNVCWFVGDVMAREIIKMEADLPILCPHHIVKRSDPSMTK